jgi:hypothetical protein
MGRRRGVSRSGPGGRSATAGTPRVLAFVADVASFCPRHCSLRRSRALRQP